ncbi:MAG: GGDEF domain-containing protein [Treponema sp.]|nr:GGDEF domain-containing protein [Treponema sp.]
MKRKIAVLANGWNHLGIASALKGIRSVTDKLNIDVFLFLSFAAFAQSQERNVGEDSIFDLTDYSEFDGVIVFSGMLNSQKTPERIAKVIVKNKIPGVSVGWPLEGLDFVGIDNFKGMFEMVDHLVKEHHIKNPVFLAGTSDHPDSNERIDATKQALALNGIELKKDRISYTNWEYLTAMKQAEEFVKSDNPPDAFICANDHNAIAVCIALQRMGYKVPQDFIVTGFDKITHAETFFPSITTVYQDFEKIGYIAAWQLMEKVEGTSHADQIIVSSSFVKNESCGCKSTEEGEQVRHEFCIKAYSNEMESLITQADSASMTNQIFNGSNYDTLKNNILNFYTNSNNFKGHDFYFVLDDSARKNLMSSSFPAQKKYSDKMCCLVAVKNDKAEYVGDFDRKDLFPGYTKGKKPKVYTFTSMHYDDTLFGYIVLSDAIDHISDTSLNHYMIQMNYNIEQYRRNCRFDELNKALRNISNTDQLTGLNNRFGMEANAVPVLMHAHEKNKKCAVMFADINRMKHINDNFGHLHGDLAIRTVASSLLKEMPQGWVGIRYGGDEFIAVGECGSEKMVSDYVKRLNKTLSTVVNSMNLPYPLTISCGYIFTDPKSSQSLVDYINQADSIMYVHKQKTYEEEKEKNQTKSVSTDIKSLDELPHKK